MQRVPFLCPAMILLGAVCVPASAQMVAAPPPKSLMLDVEAGLQAVAGYNAFWGLADVYSPTSSYKEDSVWGEAYVEPGVTWRTDAASDVRLRARASGVASVTRGSDIFASVNQSRITLEDALIGLSAGDAGKGFQLDVSGGSQPYRIGSGMLIADGGVDGFERATLIFGPRQAWEVTAIVRASYRNVFLEGFHIDPRELASGNSRTIIRGARLDWTIAKDRFIGVTYGHVPVSEAPYVQAAPGGSGAPTLLFNGRDGMSFWHFYGNIAPVKSLPGLVVAWDYARQRNARLNMKSSGGRIEIANTFVTSKWLPTIAYAFQRFSGDDPDTPELERFDPLFYDGSPGGWATGSNGAFVFINSNLQAHKLKLSAMPSQQDIVTFRYSHIRADQSRSPLQFGQATRPDFSPGAPGLIAGVIQKHLSDDILLEYTHLVNQHIFITGGFSHSWPGPGLQELAFGQARQWSGGFINVVFKY